MTSNLFYAGNRLSKSSVEAVNARREQLAALVERMKSSQLQDIEATIANMSDRIKDLSECRSNYQ